MTAPSPSNPSWGLSRSSPLSSTTIRWINGTSEWPESPLSVRLFDTPCSLPLYLPDFMRSVDVPSEFHIRLGISAMCIRLLPFENEAVSGELRVQITFEANKVGT